MQLDRRSFLGSAAALALTACAGRRGVAARPLDVLVLGGTRFVGIACVEALLARGHRVALFNRGKTNPELFPECEKLVGDRDGDLTALVGRTFDLVIDTWTDTPRHVAATCELFAATRAQYVYVSSLNAVADLSVRALDESAATTPVEAGDLESSDPERFGARKVLCERIVHQRFGTRATIVRPGLIVGPHDRSDRFTYWPVRVARGGEVLAPGVARDPVQFIDVRDLGQFVVRLGEDRCGGTFHVVGPEHALGIGDVLAACARMTRSDARFTWVDARWLIERGVQPWTDLPLWLPSLEPGQAFWTLDHAKALRAGLRCRALDDTVRDTLAWWNAQRPERALKRGLSVEREIELLAAWRASRVG